MVEENIQSDLFAAEEPQRQDDTKPFAPDPAPEAKPAEKMSVRESIDSAVQEVRARDEKGRFAREEAPKPNTPDKAPAVATSSQAVEPSSEAKSAEPPPGAPQAWTKEAKVLWDSLPPSIQQEVRRREADTTKGVQQLRSRYDALDRALAPHRQVIQQSGRTEADVVSQLIGWTYALASPNKGYAKQALAHLARSFNIDLNSPGSALSPGASPGVSEIDQRIQQHLTSAVGPIQQFMQSQQQAAAEQHVMSWAKDKPHFQNVRETMARFINADLHAMATGQAPIGGFVKDGNIDLDAAYTAAVYANPETRGAAIQEEQAKKAAANKAAVDRARSAGVSVRTGTPSAPPSANGKSPPKNQSVREAIRDAWAQHRSR